MMAIKKERVFFEALIGLNRYIEEHYVENGTIPSEEALSKLFKVSRQTTRSVLSEATQRGYICKIPNKGHIIIPKRYRMRTVGVVVDFGKENPFLHLPQGFAELTKGLAQAGIQTQLIQASSPKKVHLRALAHGVEVLVWVYIVPEVLSVITAPEIDFPIPQVILDFMQHPLPKEVKRPPVQITCDFKQGPEKIARTFVERGHRSIVFMGHKDQAAYFHFRDELKQAGISHSRKLVLDVTKKGWHSTLEELTARRDYSAIYITGSLQVREEALKHIQRFAPDQQPEIIIFDDGQFTPLLATRSAFNIIACTAFDYELLGRTAVAELVGYIYKGKSMRSHTVATTAIEMLV